MNYYHPYKIFAHKSIILKNISQYFSNNKSSICANSNSTNKDVTTITIILNIWKRNYLNEQIDSLLRQSYCDFDIWILQCGSFVDVKPILKKYPFINFINSTVNLKYFGRFSLAQYVKSEYVFIVDDDVVPGVGWLENCLKICQQENAIVASAGRIIPNQDLYPEKLFNVSKCFVADVSPHYIRNHCEKDTIVDFGCNSWFLKTDWLHEFWKIAPHTMDTGEDIHLSATCKIALDVPTIVPAQLDDYTTGNLKKHYGQDALASWKSRDFLDLRAGIIEYLTTRQGWKPMVWTRTPEV